MLISISKFNRIVILLFILILVPVACSPSQEEQVTSSGQSATQVMSGDGTPVDSTVPPLSQPTSGTPSEPGDLEKPGENNASNGLPIPSVGSETKEMKLQENLPLIQEAGIDTFRYNGLFWSRIEKIEGKRDWSSVADLERRLAESASNGFQTILIVRGTPEWAQKIPGFFCGPISEEKMQAFAGFLGEAVSRYSQPPYDVKYWELWNEPDVDARLVDERSVFGCWGDTNNPYYGGEYFAEMLKAAYPAIKAADPEAQVLLGGLLLDCDPSHPTEGQECISGKFFEGVLKNGGGEYFDLVSFHGYAHYSGPNTGNSALHMDEHHPKWEQRGGVVLGKIDFLREVMANYGVDKGIFHTEGALICPPANKVDCDPPGEVFYEAQSDYVVWLYVRNWAEGLSGTVWYPFEGPGWRHAALLDENQNPKPAHRTLSFLTKELGDAGYIRLVDQLAPLAGYEFNASEKRIWVVWSRDGSSYPFTISADVRAIFDKYGNPVDLATGQVEINSPVFVEFNP